MRLFDFGYDRVERLDTIDVSSGSFIVCFYVLWSFIGPEVTRDEGFREAKP